MSTQISEQQLFNRWNALSQPLRDAIVSETNSKIICKAAENEHLTKDKTGTVLKSVGYVLMGFIHPEELAKEINESLGIDIRIATSIADPINKKIFQPIQEELETIYSPAGDEGEQVVPYQPIMIDSVGSPETKDAIKPKIIPPIAEKQTLPADLTKKTDMSQSAVPVPKPAQVAQAPKQATPAPVPSPKPASLSASVPSLNQFSASRPPSSSVPKDLSAKPDQPAAKLPVPPVAPAPSASPAPFILHMESSSQPIAPAKSGFKVGLSEEQFGKMEQKWTAPPKPAQIETNFAPEPKPVLPNRPVAETSKFSSLNQFAPRSIKDETKKDTKVVHYNELKTPIAPTPKDKSILPSQIMPGKIDVSAQARIQPVITKAPPRPPVPPATQQKNEAQAATVPARVVPQKFIEGIKQEGMLPGKPSEKELPAPQK